MVVGRVVPIAIEGGGERKGYASWRSNHVKPFIRRRSSSLGLKQITRKGSRSNLISVQVQIQLEDQDEKAIEESSQDEKKNCPTASSNNKKFEKQISSGRLPLRVVPQPAYGRPTTASRASAATTQPTLTRRASINKLLSSKPKSQLNLENKKENLATQSKPLILANKSAKLATHTRRISLENLNKPVSISPVTKPVLNSIHLTLKKPVTVVETVFENDTGNKTQPSQKSATVVGRSTSKKDRQDNLVAGNKAKDEKEVLQNVTVSPTSQDNEQKESATDLLKQDDENKFSPFEIELLEGHNKCRARHGVQPLRLDKKLCEYSQKWAQKLARLDILEHSGSHQYGENLYCAWNSDPAWTLKGEEAVYSWYSEIEEHKYGRKARNPETGHFTQVVWKNSKDLGIGLAKSKSGKMIVVCNYSPAGNFIGQYKENVPKAIEIAPNIANDKENAPNIQTSEDVH